jgi:hypothetical protein
VRVAVVEDRLRLRRADAGQRDELFLGGGVEIDCGGAAKEHSANASASASRFMSPPSSWSAGGDALRIARTLRDVPP